MCTRPDQAVQYGPDGQSISVQMSIIISNQFSCMKSHVAVESTFLHLLNRVLNWFGILIRLSIFDAHRHFDFC